MLDNVKKKYLTDLRNAEWQMIDPLLTGPKHLGRKQERN
jgi:hypothetical protein